MYQVAFKFAMEKQRQKLAIGQLKLERKKRQFKVDKEKFVAELENAMEFQKKMEEHEDQMHLLTYKVVEKKIRLNKLTTATLKLQKDVALLKTKLVEESNKLETKVKELDLREKEVERREREAQITQSQQEDVALLKSKLVEESNKLETKEKELDLRKKEVERRERETRPTRSHTTYRQLYRCDVHQCSETFSNYHAFQRHNDKHNGRIHPCPNCSMVFGRYDCLRRHLVTMHNFQF